LNTLALIPCWLPVFYIILLAFAFQRANNRTGKLFAYYLGIAAFWSFTSFMVHLNAPATQTIFWNKILIVALIWTLVAYYHFTLGYTDRRPGPLLYLAYISLAVLALISASGHAVAYSYVLNGVTNYLLYTPAKLYIGITGLSFSALVISLLVVKYRRSNDPRERNRTVYLFVGWGLLVVLTYTNFISSLKNLPLDHIGNFINALIISYAISQYRLLDIKLVARTGMAYFLSLAFVLGGCVGTVLLVLRVFPDSAKSSIVLFVTVVLILLIAVFRPLHRVLQKLVDRIFYPQTYEYRHALMGFSAKMSYILDLNELALEMLPTLCKALDANWAGLLLQNNDSGDFTLKYVQPEPATKQELSFSADSLVISWLDKNDLALDPKQIDNIPEFHGLWQAEREQLTKSGLGILYPLKSRDRLICILALGQKTPGAHLLA